MRKIILSTLLFISTQIMIAQPTLNGPVSATVCRGVDATFTVVAMGSVPFTYQWQLDTGTGFADIPDGPGYTGNTTASLTVRNVQSSFDGYIYRCQVMDSNLFSTISNPAKLTVIPPSAQPGSFTVFSATVCQGQSGVVYTVPNDPTVNYIWSYSGTGAMINGSTNSITIDFGITATSGILGVIATTGCDTSATQSIAITVNPLPSQPGAFIQSSPSVCGGQTGVIYTVPNDPTVTFNWNYTGSGSTINITANSVTVNFNASAVGGTLSVTSSNSCGTSAARTMDITVKPLPSQPGNFTVSTTPVCAGQNGIMYTVPEDTGITYNWAYSGTNTIISGIGNSIALNFANNATSGSLSVSTTNSCGTSPARTFSITVNALPTGVSFTQSSPYSSTGADVKFAHTPLGGLFSGIGVTSSDSTFHPSLVGPGKYAVKYTYTNSKGCSNSFTDTVIVISPSGNIFGFGANGVVCYSSAVLVIKGTPGINPHSGINNDWFEVDGIKNGKGIIQIADSTANFNPKLAGSGIHILKYKYQIGATVFEIAKSITVDSVAKTTFIGLQTKYCDQEPSDTITGINPSGGTGHFIFNGPSAGFMYPVNSNNNQAAINPHAIVLAIPGFTGATYNISYYYTSPLGCRSDTVVKNVAIFALPLVNFNIRSSFNVAEPPVKLSGNPAGGIFSGRGIVPSDTTFSPALATVQNHIPITYTYTDIHGCSNAVTKFTDVVMANAFIKGLPSNNTYCYDGPADTLIGVSMNGIPGGFISGIGIRKFGKSDTALFFPNLAGNGSHVITYSYTNSDGTPFSVSAVVTVDSIGPVAINGLQNEYCANNKNQITITILTLPAGQPGTITFTGSGVSKNTTSQYFFVPANDNLSSGNVILTYSRNFSGCKSTSQKTITIDPVPAVNFALNNLCVINQKDSIGFINKTSHADQVISWSWNFGDNQVPAINNVSSLFQPKHAYVSGGPKTITLTATTNKGCSSTKDSVVSLGNSSKASFTWSNECYYNDSSTTFIAATFPANQITYVWNFGDNSTKTDVVNIVTHHYTTSKNYSVRLIVLNNFGCRDTLIQTVYLRKVFVIRDSSYYAENFAQGKNGWIASTANASNISSWTFGKSSKFNTPAGDSLWYTIPEYRTEQSWVTSPCFDFSEAKKPMIKFDRWSSFDKNRDGAILQYKANANSDWRTLGTISDGINWYESSAILGRPGNQQNGWSGLDNTFVSARHQLSALAGEKEVQFRFVYASDGSNRNDNGFAFDNINISERQHVVLLEHYTNTSATQSTISDAIVDSISSQEPLDMVSVKYHTDLFGGDLFDQSIHSVSDVRSIYYGVPAIPYSILDGGTSGKYDYKTRFPKSQDIELRSLIDPLFKITLRSTNNSNVLNISTKITALTSFNREVSIHIAVVRMDTTISNKKMKNILLALLPDPAGITYNQNWLAGDSKMLTTTFSVSNISDTNKLVMVAFVQDETSKEILQVATNKEAVISTGINIVADPDQNDAGFKIFPNPARDIVYVAPNNLTGKFIIEIYNSMGILVKILRQEMNANNFNIDISGYPNGMYVIKLITFNNQVFTHKLIINH